MPYSFHELKNYLLNDSLSDWFDKISLLSDDFKKDKKNSFYEEIEKQKKEYHNHFLFFLKNNTKIYEYLNNNTTRDIMKNKEKCIFYKPELYHQKYDILVKPDFIIHRDLFFEIFNKVNLSDSVSQNLPEYIIFDLLYKKISFNADKSDILNDGTIFYHKCKLLIATECLYKKHKIGFFIAKDYKHRDKTLPKKENIGVFSLSDDYKEKINNSISWLHKLNKNYNEWIIYPKPSCIELYPNLNIKIGHWNGEKKLLGELIKEITLIWNISYSKRCILIEKGVSQWNDPLLLSNIYPYQIKDNKRKFIQDKIIHINQQDSIKISPRKIKNKKFIDIIKNKQNSIILDIESILDLKEKENYFNNDINIEKPRICIIGTIISETNIFKDFTIRYCKNSEEKIIIQYWLSYIKKQINNDIIKIYHWGNAEKVYIDYMKKKYPDLTYPQFEMIDLINYFKMEPITIKGCFGYGLKEIVNSLYNLELLNDKWIDDTNGLDAMTELMKTSEEAQIKNIPMKRFIKIKNLIYYNYMDCKVIVDILQMLEDMI